MAAGFKHFKPHLFSILLTASNSNAFNAIIKKESCVNAWSSSISHGSCLDQNSNPDHIHWPECTITTLLLRYNHGITTVCNVVIGVTIQWQINNLEFKLPPPMKSSHFISFLANYNWLATIGGTSTFLDKSWQAKNPHPVKCLKLICYLPSRRLNNGFAWIPWPVHVQIGGLAPHG